MLWERYPNGYLSQVTPPDYYDWATQNRTFDAMAGFTAANADTRRRRRSARAGAITTCEPAVFRGVGCHADRGPDISTIGRRAIRPSSSSAKHSGERRFGADPTIVGRSIVVGGQPRTVIGIVPDRFQVVPATISNAGSEPPQIWTVFNMTGGGPAMRRAHYLYVIGRIKAGVSMAAAQEDLTAIGARNAELYPDTNKGHDPTLQPMREALVGSEMRLTSLLLLGVVGFVLLMCCANLANLFLARTNARARELAVRFGTWRHTRARRWRNS